MTDESNGELDAAMMEWLAAVAGVDAVTATRRTGGASRAGHAVDGDRPDGTRVELWLRSDPGFGPQSGTRYSLRREAAVYRALEPTPVRVARLVAVHPDRPAFVLERLPGESRFARIPDPDAQRAIAREFIAQLATLHHLDPAALELPELGPTGSLAGLVHDEIDEWARQYHAAGGGVPVISSALVWLRGHVPTDGDWPIVLVQGDTGPGNFMFVGDRLVAITDWELAHWGDLHDDIAWLFVRDALERFPELADRIAEYERISGFTVDPVRLRYFRVLAQTRAAVGTLVGLRSRDARGEIAWQMIYNTFHCRLLAEALAEEMGVPPRPERGEDITDPDGPHSWVFDVALDDLRDVVLPALDDDFAATRAKGVARLLKFARELDRLGPALEAAERAELATLIGRGVDDLDAGRRALCDAIDRATVDPHAALAYCLHQAVRDGSLMRPAMGALADRHLTPIGPPGSRGGDEREEPSP